MDRIRERIGPVDDIDHEIQKLRDDPRRPDGPTPAEQTADGSSSGNTAEVTTEAAGETTGETVARYRRYRTNMAAVYYPPAIDPDDPDDVPAYAAVKVAGVMVFVYMHPADALHPTDALRVSIDFDETDAEAFPSLADSPTACVPVAVTVRRPHARFPAGHPVTVTVGGTPVWTADTHGQERCLHQLDRRAG